MQDKITFFGETDSRNKKVKFGIKASDRTRHVYVIGKTGMGKSTLLENMAVQDIQNGEGMAFIDPHGKTAELLLRYVPQHRLKDVLYFAPFDIENPISFNVMEDIGADKRHLVASGLMSTFKKIWVDAWSARMEYILNNTILALLEYPGATLLGVNKMLADKEYRKKVVDNISDPSVKSFWVDEFAKYTDKFAAEATPAIQNKIGQFTSNPLIRNIIGQSKSSFNIREMMDQRKILIINLSKGRVGESNANLLGSMLITKIYLAAMSRADVREKEAKSLPNFYLFVDEFQSFANESFADILSEARKYKLNLTIAHQYIEQMSEEVRAAVFGNVGTMISFRVGAYDAETLEKEFAPQFTAEDMVNLGFAQIYLKLMIDGVSSAPFSASTLPPIKENEISYRDDVIEESRKQFARNRAEVEAEIMKWHDGESRTGNARTESPAPQSGRSENRGSREGNGSSRPPERPRMEMKDRRDNNNGSSRNLERQEIMTTTSSKTVIKPVGKEPVRVVESIPVEPEDKDFIPLTNLKANLPPVVSENKNETKPVTTEKREEIKTAPVLSNNSNHNSKIPIGGKKPTADKLAELRAALQKATHKETAVESKVEKKTEEPVVRPKVSVMETGAKKNEVIKEIPKTVLEQLLKVEDKPWFIYSVSFYFWAWR